MTSGKGGVLLRFETDSVMVQTAESFSNKLYLHNNTSNSITLVKLSKDAAASIPLPDTIQLSGNESRTCFTKYFALPSFLRSAGSKITARYKILQSQTEVVAAFSLRINTGASLFVQSTAPVLYITEQNNPLTVTFRCINNGYTGLRIKLFLKSYPDGLQAQHNGKEIYLDPGAQQEVTFTIQNTLPGSITPDYNLMLQAMDSTGRSLSGLNTKVIFLGSNKRLTQDALNSSTLNNYIQLGYWGSNSGYSYAQLQLKGNTGVFANGVLNYNLNINQYTGGQHGTDLFDTRIEYRNRHIAIQAGSIYDNLDFSILGNGVKGSVLIDSQNTVSAYYVQNNYYLYSTFNRSSPGGNLWAASYNFNPSPFKSASVNFINGTNPMTGAFTSLGNTNIKIPLKKQQSLQIEGGISREHIDTINKAAAKEGYSIGIHYANNGARWKIYASNYFSSPYYSGFRRGALLLEERIERRWGLHQYIYLRYQKNNSTPAYLNNHLFNYSYHTKASIYEAGVGRYAKGLALNIRPYYFTQQLQQFYDPSAISSASIRAAIDISLSAKGNTFTATGDIGNTKTNNPWFSIRQYNSWLFRFNYTYKFAGINMQLQHNPYYIIQEPTQWQQQPFRQYSFGPVIYFKALSGKLNGQVSDYLTYYSNAAGWSNALQLQATMQINNTLQASTMFTSNANEWDPAHPFILAHLSITKNIVQHTAPGYRNVELIFFGDENANGICDKGERKIPGVIASLDNIVALSDRKGRLKYTNLKPGTYTVRVQPGNEWSVIQPVVFIASRHRRIRVGMIKSAMLSGSIIVEKNPYTQQALNIEGITIVATDDQGTKYTGLTDIHGNFRLTLPVNRYSLSVNTDGYPFSVSDQAQQIHVQQQNNPGIIFHLTDQSRKVEVKEF